jgi:biotin transport system substrate-specific component
MITQIELLRTYDRRLVWIRDVAVVLGAAYLLAMSAQVRLLLPFSPVPVTGQSLVVLLIGALMGRRLALASLGTYLAAGMVGLPFFAGGSLWGPTGGYLLGFVVAVYVLTLLMERNGSCCSQRSTPVRARAVTVVGALVAGNLIIYLIGVPWLAAFVGLRAALPLGLFPFIVGDLAKLVCAVGIVLAWDRFRVRDF